MRKRFKVLLRTLLWFSVIALVFGVAVFIPPQPSLALTPGSKQWVNTWTEVEYLGNGKFGATIHSTHQVFFDKTDGDRPKKHKLTDERPDKDYVLMQSASVSVEVYPYYAKYFDPQHEEVRLYEERWVVQRLFKEPDTWRDVGAWNPRMDVEEYPEPAGGVVKVTITYDTDYGPLMIEYFLRDGNSLKHNITFQNTSGGTETFRILQRWAGIVGSKVNGKTTPVVEDTPFLAFQRADGALTISENLASMMFNEDGTEKSDHRLQGSISIESHARGMKTDFVYGNWVLAQNEVLTMDPATATLDDPTEDGYLRRDGTTQANCPSATLSRRDTDADIWLGGAKGDGNSDAYRGYVEWDISSLAGKTLTANPVFKYHSSDDDASSEEINPVTNQPSVTEDATLWTDLASGTAYVDPWPFAVGANQSQDLGASAKTDLQSAMDALQLWWALAFQGPDDECPPDGAPSILYLAKMYSEDKTDAPTPKPTLYVEYSVGWEGKVSGITNPAKVMGVEKANIQKVHGVE